MTYIESMCLVLCIFNLDVSKGRLVEINLRNKMNGDMLILLLISILTRVKIKAELLAVSFV